MSRKPLDWVYTNEDGTITCPISHTTIDDEQDPLLDPVVFHHRVYSKASLKNYLKSIKRLNYFQTEICPVSRDTPEKVFFESNKLPEDVIYPLLFLKTQMLYALLQNAYTINKYVTSHKILSTARPLFYIVALWKLMSIILSLYDNDMLAPPDSLKQFTNPALITLLFIYNILERFNSQSGINLHNKIDIFKKCLANYKIEESRLTPALLAKLEDLITPYDPKLFESYDPAIHKPNTMFSQESDLGNKIQDELQLHKELETEINQKLFDNPEARTTYAAVYRAH